MKPEKEITKGECPSCGKNRAQPEHTCPFAEEIRDDSTTMCRCCADCQHQCTMDI